MADALDQTMEALRATMERPFDSSAQERFATLLAQTNSHYNVASAFATAAWLYRRDHDYASVVRMLLHAATYYRKARHDDLADLFVKDASRVAERYGVVIAS